MKSTATTRVIERGILTSAYKREIRKNVRDLKSKSISRIKKSFRNHHERLQSQTGTILQVSLFAVILVMILF